MQQDLYPTRQADRPAVTPRLDPVAYNGWQPGAPLMAEQIERFDRDGFLVVEDIFEEPEIESLVGELGRLLSDPASLQPETVVTEPGEEEIRSIFAVHEQSRLIARLAADERLAGIASYLLGDEVYIHQSRLNYKPGFKGKDFYWHSDFETWHAEDGMPRMRALSMSILLAENTPNNGPLMLIPGSHRSYLSCVGETPDDHYRQSLKKQEIGVPDEQNLAEMAWENGIVAPTGKPGTVIIFDCNTIHGSNGNITPFPRANVFFVYNAMSNRLVEPFAAPRPRPEFVGTRQPKPLRPVSGPLTGEPA